MFLVLIGEDTKNGYTIFYGNLNVTIYLFVEIKRSDVKNFIGIFLFYFVLKYFGKYQLCKLKSEILNFSFGFLLLN